MDLDTFFVWCELLMDRRLNQVPVLIGGTTGRGVVVSHSYETRQSKKVIMGNKINDKNNRKVQQMKGKENK